MFDDELYISYLSRIYARYGFIEVGQFNQELFLNSRKTLDLDIINPIKIDLLSISKESLIKGSLFTYQYMFIGGEKFEKIYMSMMYSDGSIQKLNMRITPSKQKRFLKYCSYCYREETEPYFHISHQYSSICLKHHIKLVESSISIGSKEKITYKTLIEEKCNREIEKNEISNEEINFFEYVEQVVRNGITFKKKDTISDYLSYWIIKRAFTTTRQNALRTIKLYKYCKNKFRNFIDFDFPTLSTFKSVLKGFSYNTKTILIIAYSLEIPSSELKYQIKRDFPKNNVDMIKKLYRDNLSQEYISKLFNVTRQYISKIINDLY
jgi:hypothetical protein